MKKVGKSMELFEELKKIDLLKQELLQLYIRKTLMKFTFNENSKEWC